MKVKDENSNLTGKEQIKAGRNLCVVFFDGSRSVRSLADGCCTDWLAWVVVLIDLS